MVLLTTCEVGVLIYDDLILTTFVQTEMTGKLLQIEILDIFYLLKKNYRNDKYLKRSIS